MDTAYTIQDQHEGQWLQLLAASERLTGARSIDDIVTVLRETARSIASAEGIAVVIRCEDTCFYAAEDAIEKLWAGNEFPAESCVSGWAMQHRATVTINDIRLDERIPQDAYRPTFVRSLVMVPIGMPEPVAALGAYWSDVREHDPRVVAKLEALARLATLAIENAKLLTSIQESEHRLQLALSVGRGIGVWDWDVPNDRVVADERFAQLYGVDPVKARVGVSIVEFFAAIHPDDIEPLKVRIAEALKTGEPFSAEYRLVRADGIRWVVAEGRCGLAPDGTPLRFPGVTFDITDRKESEERLRLLNADLERQVIERSSERGTTWQVSPMLLSVVDLKDGRFLRANPAWTSVLGWSEQEISDVPYLDFLHPEDITATVTAFEQLRRGIPVLDFENRYRSKDGSYRWLSWLAVPEDGKVYSTARDISHEKERAEALAHTAEALRQAQKMEAVGQLTGGLAHDFNNILAGLSGSMELIQARVSQGRLDTVERYISAGMGAIKRAAALTHRLLAFSRRQTLDPRPVDVNRLVNDMAELIQRTVGPGIHVDVIAATGLWRTMVDANQLDNALLNLCLNARDAMPDGGRLTIETANETLDESAAAESQLKQGQYISLSVSDDGCGMKPEVVAKAFDPFFTTKPIGEGTGLGLSMIYGFARQSGGQVRLFSAVGQGTTARIYLPRHDISDEAEPPTSMSVAPPPSGGGEVVLVIDDEPVIRMLIADVLADLGYVCLDAPDGPSGLQLLQTMGRIDLLITDVGLPGGLNGRQVADAARVTRPDLKVLFITGYAENAAIGKGRLDPGMQVAIKPFAVDELARKIRTMIEQT